jgi:hypothetical protein
MMLSSSRRLPSALLQASTSTGRRGLAAAAAASGKKVVLVDGARIPFAMSSTIYSDYLGVDLQKMAYKVCLLS